MTIEKITYRETEVKGEIENLSDGEYLVVFKQERFDNEYTKSVYVVEKEGDEALKAVISVNSHHIDYIDGSELLQAEGVAFEMVKCSSFEEVESMGLDFDSYDDLRFKEMRFYGNLIV